METHNNHTQRVIIAIGASKGSINELCAFFGNTLLRGASYIIIQLLTPDDKSRIAAILVTHHG